MMLKVGPDFPVSVVVQSTALKLYKKNQHFVRVLVEMLLGLLVI